MKSRIEEIKKRSHKIDTDELIKMGKHTFDTRHFEEFEDNIGPAYILDETYTCYSEKNKLVLECFMKYCKGKNSGQYVKDSDFTKSRDIVYIKGKEVKQFRMEEGIDNNITYKEVLDIIGRCNKRSDMQNQHIRNFFRRIFRGRNSNLLDGENTSLTEEEIVEMLSTIQEKPKKFMDKYNKKKSKEEKDRDTIQKLKEQLREIEIEEESGRG